MDGIEIESENLSERYILMQGVLYFFIFNSRAICYEKEKLLWSAFNELKLGVYLAKL